MLKHRGFPGRLPGTDFQFTIRRANKKGATPLVRRERFRDRKAADRRADEGFMAALIRQFGEEPFPRGNLDAGRLSWLIGREVVAIGKLDPTGLPVAGAETARKVLDNTLPCNELLQAAWANSEGKPV